ncbi:hypothetical protein [Domibacillus aminovorans]|uniref:LexA repressor DNA-binding domain-containing protein n=1 Tax=Domibacillus aminovorans TaxID=29332 RepID=A0A177LBG4_9BACI|nr:hypothetical protein AWH49_10940 [Domibacillus aminovorans]
MPKPLTERRQKIFDYICSYIEQNNYSPSVREIGKHVGLVSTSTIQWHLDRLRADGYVTWQDGKPRTLRLLKQIG